MSNIHFQFWVHRAFPPILDWVTDLVNNLSFIRQVYNLLFAMADWTEQFA